MQKQITDARLCRYAGIVLFRGCRNGASRDTNKKYNAADREMINRRLHSWSGFIDRAKLSAERTAGYGDADRHEAAMKRKRKAVA